MMHPPDIVSFACVDPTKDRCAPLIFEELSALIHLVPQGTVVDEMPVLRGITDRGLSIDVVRTCDVLSHDLARYLPVIRSQWSSTRLGLLLNWHEGAGAPCRILPVHSTGDVPSGIFGVTDPIATASVLRALDVGRAAAGLDHFMVLPEATHWSGTQYGLEPALLAECPLPIIDVEIGSSLEDWSDRRACRTVAQAVLTSLDYVQPAPVVLFVGGVHFEPTCREGAFPAPPQGPVAFAHILANQWINGPHYEGEAGLEKLRAAMQSVRGGVDVLAFHDKLRGPIKAAVRQLADEYGVPAVNHRRLRTGDLGRAFEPTAS